MKEIIPDNRQVICLLRVRIVVLEGQLSNGKYLALKVTLSFLLSISQENIVEERQESDLFFFLVLAHLHNIEC